MHPKCICKCTTNNHTTYTTNVHYCNIFKVNIPTYLLQDKKLPDSVPTINFVAPAAGSYSSDTPPNIVSAPFSFNGIVSNDSPSLRISHHITYPSVEHVMHSVPVLLCNANQCKWMLVDANVCKLVSTDSS